VRNARISQRLRRADVDKQLRRWVASQQGGQPVEIEVIGMLMGHQNRIKSGELLKAG
jgi:uncharacterized protein YidB (DUF937 family)